jgi:hypothetical protein
LKAGLALAWHGLFRLNMNLENLARLISRSPVTGLHPVIMEFPEITVDADEPADFHFIKKVLETA